MKESVSPRPLVLLVAGAIVMGALALGAGPAPGPTSAPTMGFWEAAARGFVTVVMVNETFMLDGHTETLPVGIEVTNTASVPVVIPEEAVLMSPNPAQSPQPDPLNTTADVALTSGTVPANGKLLYSYGPYVLAGYLTGPAYWDLEEFQFSKSGVVFYVGGQTLPFALRPLVEQPDASTQTALWNYLESYPTVVVGKLPLWAKTNGSAGQTVRVRIDATNLAVWPRGSGGSADVNATHAVIEDTVPAGWSVKEGSFSVRPDVITNHSDGSQTLEWYEDLSGAQIIGQPGSDQPTPYDTVTRSYTLVAPALYDGPVTLPRALSDTNDTGTPDAHSAPVIVQGNLPPVADAGGPYTGNEGATVVLDASKSSDPDGDALQYRWSFTDNGTWDTAWSSSPTASVTYTDEFAGQVRVEVTDGHTLANATASVTIANVPPTIVSLTASAETPVGYRLATAGTKGGAVTLVVRNGGSTLTDVRVVRAPGDPFGESAADGTVSVNPTKPVLAWVQYSPPPGRGQSPANGDNPTWLNLTFANGSSRSLFHNFNAQHPSTWNWSLSGVFGRPNVLLQAHLFDPGSDALTAQWDFGDGTTLTQVFPNGPAGDAPESPVGGTAPMDVMATVLHTYAAAGSYTVTLTVTDADGASTTATLAVYAA